MTRWSRVVAALLAPGGALYLGDSHPAMNALEQQGERLVLDRPWQVPIEAPFRYNDVTTYTGAPDMLAHTQTYEWAHSFSAILGALLSAGFRLDFLHEQETLPWPAFPMMEPAGAGMFRLPASVPAFAARLFIARDAELILGVKLVNSRLLVRRSRAGRIRPLQDRRRAA